MKGVQADDGGGDLDSSDPGELEYAAPSRVQQEQDHN